MNTPAVRTSRLTTWLILLIAAGIIGLWLAATPSGIQGKADAVGYAVCHRIEVRSFIAFERPLPLCARCTGIYLGAMTGLGVFLMSGRFRASRLPNWRVLGVLGLFVAVLGLDGLNSYLTLFPGYTPLYEPHNTLRLVTGIYTGLALITLVFSMFNQSIWADEGDRQPPLRNIKELTGLSLIAGLMAALVLVERPTLLVILGLISAAGVLVVMTMLMTAGYASTVGRFQGYRSWRELRWGLLIGLTMAIVLIGSIDLLRYSFTGSWDGFVF